MSVDGIHSDAPPKVSRHNRRKRTVPLPPQNNDTAVAASVCDISKGEGEADGVQRESGTGRGVALMEAAALRQSEGWGEGGADAWSCGLAELAVNLCRFIFSGAACWLKGGQIYMPLPGPL